MPHRVHRYFVSHNTGLQNQAELFVQDGLVHARPPAQALAAARSLVGTCSMMW